MVKRFNNPNVSISTNEFQWARKIGNTQHKATSGSFHLKIQNCKQSKDKSIRNFLKTDFSKVPKYILG